jgi:hypothetical protein
MRLRSDWRVDRPVALERRTETLADMLNVYTMPRLPGYSRYKSVTTSERLRVMRFVLCALRFVRILPY